jgi:hypothetical protein
MRKAFERFPRDHERKIACPTKVRHGGVFQRARNMPEEQLTGNLTSNCSEVSVAGVADGDGSPLGIDEAHALTRLDPADPCDQ